MNDYADVGIWEFCFVDAYKLQPVYICKRCMFTTMNDAKFLPKTCPECGLYCSDEERNVVDE